MLRLVVLLLAVAAAVAQIEVTGNGFNIPEANTPTYEARTLFQNVVDEETNAFRIGNPEPLGGLVLSVTNIAITGAGFSLEEPADAFVMPQQDTLFSVKFVATAGGTYSGQVTITYSVGTTVGATYTFNVEATVAEVELVINDDAYTTSWAEELVVDAAAGVLANDVSLQGTLAVTETGPLSGPGRLVSFDLATGAFTLNVTEALFNGEVSFTYTATNGFATVTANVVVTVTDANSNIECQDNIVLEAPTGTDQSAVFYTIPTASFGAPVSQASGPASGDVLTFGDSPYTVVYEAAGLDGISPSQCSFTIEITIQPPTIECQDDVLQVSVANACDTALSLSPDALSGFQTVITGVDLTTGAVLALDGQDVFAVGSHVVELTITDSIGQTDVCAFQVSVSLLPEESQFNQLAGWIDADRDGHGQLVDEFGFDSECVVGTRDPTRLDLFQLGRSGLLSAFRDDCNDNDATQYPGHNEVCDGKDNNCNGLIDEGRACRPTHDRPVQAEPIHIPTLVSFAPIRVLSSEVVEELPEVAITVSSGARVVACFAAMAAAVVIAL